MLFSLLAGLRRLRSVPWLLVSILVIPLALGLAYKFLIANDARTNNKAPVYSQAWAVHKFPAGTPAPDFALRSYPDNAVVRLSSLRGQKPVVLVFGSFTCNLFCGHTGRLVELHKTYKDRAQFYFIYIAEAAHHLPFPSPEGGRLGRIAKGLEVFHIPFPCLVATQDSEVEKDYDPWPARLMLVDREGYIAFDAGRGVRQPWDLEAFEARLRALPVAP